MTKPIKCKLCGKEIKNEIEETVIFHKEVQHNIHTRCYTMFINNCTIKENRNAKSNS